jgi:hypothetical protein
LAVVALRGEHDDRHAGLTPDRPTHVDAAHAGQHQVEQDDVGTDLPERVQGPFAVGDEGRQETFAPQHDAEHLGERGIIIDHQYTGPHAIQYSHLSRGLRDPPVPVGRLRSYPTPLRPCVGRRGLRRMAPPCHDGGVEASG